MQDRILAVAVDSERDGRLAVRDMPDMIAEACIERGYSDDDKLTPTEALSAWSAWEIGDGWWAETIIHHFQEMTSKARGDA
jgi:hypothetical protein